MSGIHGDKPSSSLRTAKKAAAVIANGDVLFTVSGGAILARSVTGYCITANDATASTFQLSADPTEGAAAATISGASASLANAAVGTSILVTLATAAAAPVVVAAGVGVISHTTGAFIPPGVVTAVVGVGSTTGTWEWVIQYEPLDPNVIVS